MFLRKEIINIEGMSCEHCVKKLSDALKKINGVAKAKVSLEDGSASIYYKNEIDLNEIKTVIEGLGYKVC